MCQVARRGVASALRTSALLPRGVRGGRTVMSMNFLSGLFPTPPKREVNYEGLAGLPFSFAKEAASYALKGEIPKKSKDGYDVATFAAGCFWGIELAFQRVPGTIATSVGYCQGQTEKPTYDEVCSGRSGHTEAVQLIYDPKQVSYEQLLDVFWDTLGNDATRYHQVGRDSGPQYRHGVYAHTEEQLELAKNSFKQRQAQFKKPIQTEIEPVQIYWPAEEYHQQYLQKGGRFGSPQSAEKGATDTIRCYG